MGFWAKSVVIYNCIRQHGKLSIRLLARHTGFSKSSVHWLEQARKRRDHHPESWFWETQEGRSWFLRLVVATLYTFGLKRGVGAETLREFFVRLRLETQLGCSPNALRGLMEKLVQASDATTTGWEAEGIAHGQARPLIGAVDETFLEQMMLVFMDLFSGYLVVEDVAPDRSYDTWYDLVKARLKTLGVGGRYLVSDGPRRSSRWPKRVWTARVSPISFTSFMRWSKVTHWPCGARSDTRIKPCARRVSASNTAKTSIPVVWPPHRPRSWWQRVKPKSSAGRVCIAPIGVTWKPSRFASIRGVCWRRRRRPRRMSRASCTLRPRPSKG